jgi:anti-sigma factor RsiW
MPRRDHLSDCEMILLADGELRAGETDARGHLEACWSCRSRMAEIQGTIADFVRSYHDSLDARLPPPAGPRALLRAQLENQATSKNSGWTFAGQWASVSASLLVACLVIFAVYERGVARRAGDLSIPKNSLTPGETRNVTVDDVCRPDQEGALRTVPVSLKQQVFREYGINDMRPNAYEVDYLITPELGGSGSIRNLWPQPYSAVWNAHVKDELEDRLHGLVCAGQVDLGTAQREISRDWISAYKKYFHTDKPF